MIRITRNLMVGGFMGLAVLAGTSVFAAAPAWADYQTGVDAYYKGDFKAAYDSWLPLAEAGDAVAQNSLGALYDHGLGVSEDKAEAARWYEMAAQQGLPLAMRNLGNQYATGHGVPFDLDMAQQWYEKGAAAGDQQSAALLNHLRPASAPPSDSAAAAATPTFTTPSVTGNLAEPAEGAAPAAAAADTVSTGDDNLVIASDPAAAPATPVPDAPIALDLGNNTVTMPAAGAAAAATPAPAAPAPQVAAPPAAIVQQAAVTPAVPAPARMDGNWLVGQWQGPSLGCPAGGGVEFTDSETLSWFDGQVAVRLSSAYKISGDNIVVTATGGDGVPQQYTYQRSGPDKMIIVSIPPSMPKSLLGIAYRRCAGNAPAPTVSASAATPEPSVVPAGTPVISSTESTAPAVAPAATTPTTATVASAAAIAGTAKPVPPTGAATPYALNEQASFGQSAIASDAKAAEGWQAFEHGQYDEALTVFRSLAEAGNTNMQVLVGSMYDYGQGVPQDDVQALQWYLMAAAHGNAKAQYQAATLYFNSPTVPRDTVEAYRWTSLAAKGPAGQSTTIWAQQLLSVLAANMTLDEIDDAKSLAKNSVKTN